MDFKTPAGDVAFEIPDEWWHFAEMGAFRLNGGRFYPYSGGSEIDAVPLTEIEPPTRDAGVPPFKKYKMVPVLFAISSPGDALLPAVTVDVLPTTASYRFKVLNGYHRYYASVAVGFPFLPVIRSL